MGPRLCGDDVGSLMRQRDLSGCVLSPDVNPQALVANAALPVNNVKELIAYAKSNPGKLKVASSGIGTPNHLGAEMPQHGVVGFVGDAA